MGKVMDTRQTVQLTVVVCRPLGENGFGVKVCDKSGAVNHEWAVEISLERRPAKISQPAAEEKQRGHACMIVAREAAG